MGPHKLTTMLYLYLEISHHERALFKREAKDTTALLKISGEGLSSQSMAFLSIRECVSTC